MYLFSESVVRAGMSRMTDELYMRRALKLAERGRETTAPNPWVGCVITSGTNILSEAFHVRKGGPHAERVALANLPTDISATLCVYVTLEPCCHFGATSPCVDALLEMKTISRVVVAVLDPDEKVAGRGIAKLRAAGIQVTLGVCEAEVRHSLRAYLFQRTHDRPFVVGKLGITLNGVIKGFKERRWITSEASRAEGMVIRRQSQAILVGVNTVIDDNPQLTLRGGDGASSKFLRVVIDPHCRLQETFNVISDTSTDTLIFSLEKYRPQNQLPPHIEQIFEESMDLDRILAVLAKRGVIQVLVEGGATTISKFIEANLLNELTLFMAPTMMEGVSFFNSSSLAEWTLVSANAVTDGHGDVRLDYSR